MCGPTPSHTGLVMCLLTDLLEGEQEFVSVGAHPHQGEETRVTKHTFEAVFGPRMVP